MGCIRPATPGFIVTLVATILLAIVSFCVPFVKSVYFLKANITVEGITGSITFGTLGYCLELSNGTTCTKPSIGYELDINGLVGNNLPIEIPQVAVKWITYALFAHVVALALAAGSALFGLLAHVREMSMTCCSTCVSGFAAGVALLAFIFDLVLFFVAKARINAVGTASMGNAIWLTLAAWVLLFFSGCFYTLGRCCVSRRPKMSRGSESGWRDGFGRESAPKNDYTEQMRLDAVKAEADRKARERQQKEVGLPPFAETQPLTARVEGDHVYVDDDSKDALSTGPPSLSHSKASQNSLGNNRPNYPTGYVQGTPGNRAVDEYYNPTGTSSSTVPNTYPPQPHRQASAHAYSPSGYDANAAYGSTPQRQPSGYTPTSAGPYAQTGYGAYQSTSPPPMPSQSLGVPGQVAYSDPYDYYNQSGQQYGHTTGGSSYHTASSHNQQPSAYSQYDPYGQAPASPTAQQGYYSPQPHQQYGEQPAFLVAPSDPYAPQPSSYPAPLAPAYGGAVATGPSPPPASSNYNQQPPQRQFTLGGDGYGANSVPPLPDHDPYSEGYANPTSPVRGPRPQPGAQATIPEEAPPGYDQGGSSVTGHWGKR